MIGENKEKHQKGLISLSSAKFFKLASWKLCSRQEGELQNKWNLGSGRGETCKTIQIEVDKGKDWEKNQNVILTICIINFWWKEESLGFVLVNPLSGWILSHVIHRLYLMMQLNSLVRWHKTRLSIRKLSKAL